MDFVLRRYVEYAYVQEIGVEDVQDRTEEDMRLNLAFRSRFRSRDRWISRLCLEHRPLPRTASEHHHGVEDLHRPAQTTADDAQLLQWLAHTEIEPCTAIPDPYIREYHRSTRHI